MNPKLLAFFVILSLFTTGNLPATDSAVTFELYSLILPAGFEDHPGQGIDSRIGIITVKDTPFEIRYDDFGWAIPKKKLSELPKETLDSLIYYEVFYENNVSKRIYAQWDPRTPDQIYLRLEFLEVGPHFNLTIQDGAKFRDAITTLRSLKVIKRETSSPTQ